MSQSIWVIKLVAPLHIPTLLLLITLYISTKLSWDATARYFPEPVIETWLPDIFYFQKCFLHCTTRGHCVDIFWEKLSCFVSYNKLCVSKGRR